MSIIIHQSHPIPTGTVYTQKTQIIDCLANYSMYQFMSIEAINYHYMNSCINIQTTINTQVKYDNKHNDSIEIIHRIHVAVYQRLKQRIN